MRVAPIFSFRRLQVQDRKQAKLVDAAQQFEATMLQELLNRCNMGESSWGEEQQ